MEQSVHQWGRLYKPTPGYVCRNCSIAVAEFEIREKYGRGAVNYGRELDRLLPKEFRKTCPDDRKFTEEAL